MTIQNAVIDQPTEDSVRDALEAARSRHPQPDDGYRSRPGLSPLQASLDLMRRGYPQRACIISDQQGSVLAVRYRQDSERREVWEAVACCGFPGEECYRHAYAELFSDTEREAPAKTIMPENPPTTAPRDPRPTVDGWAMSVWFTDHDHPPTTTATRLVVRHYEDQRSSTNIAQYHSHPAVLRMASEGE